MTRGSRPVVAVSGGMPRDLPTGAPVGERAITAFGSRSPATKRAGVRPALIWPRLPLRQHGGLNRPAYEYYRPHPGASLRSLTPEDREGVRQ